MQIIIQNPYRTVGLLANCTEREIQKQKGLIKRFVDVGKDVVFDTDIQFPNECKRDSESISAAFAKIEQAKSRVANGLFWFVNSSHLDEPAINYLREGDNDKAIEIWNKLTQNFESEVSARNCTAIHNLSTLKLGLAFSNGAIDKLLLTEGLLLKAKLLNSEFITNVTKTISDETFQANKEEMTKLFADELLLNISPFLDNSSGITSSDFIEIFKHAPENLKAYVSKKFVDKPFHAIETLIDETEKKRKATKTNAYEYGSKLFTQTKSNLELLKNILGITNLQYTMLADKIASELLQCSTDYFNTLKDSDNDPGVKSLQLTKFGNSIAYGSKIKEKIKDDLKFLEEWNADKPEREKHKKIDADYDFIKAALDEFQNKNDSIENARALINRCKQKLQNVKNILGSTDELYLTLSSRVGSDAQGMIVSEINKVQDAVIKKAGETYSSYEKRAYYDVLKAKLKEAYAASLLIGTLDMNSNFRTRYNENKITLQGMCTQMGVSTSAYTTPQGTTTSTSNSEMPTWVFWVGGIILLIILSKACN
jgi:hypothetical protein